MNNKLIISDIDAIQITKIKYNKLYFKYDGVRYFILAMYDCGDQWYTLYKKEFVNNKWSVTEIISSDYTIASPKNLIDDVAGYKCNIIYSHINKKYFVKQLVENGLVEMRRDNLV